MRSLVKWTTRVAGILLLSYLYFAIVHPVQVVPEHPFFSGGEPVVIAHQGGRGLWPENTLFAFEQARALGVDVLEMDLQVTRDGALVVMHDDSVDRTTNGRGRVASFTLEELEALDAGFTFQDAEGDFSFRGRGLKVPTLEEVLERFPEARLNLEMKSFTDDDARRFCETLERHDATARSLVASFDHAQMRVFRGACPEVATSATVREGLLFYQLGKLGLGSLYRSPAVAFQVPEYFGDIHVIDEALLERSRRSNLRVQVWTVNETEDMKRLLALGVNGVITDRPDRLLEVLAATNRRSDTTAQR